MNKTISEAIEYCTYLSNFLPQVHSSRIQPFFIPPFTALNTVSNFIKNNDLNWFVGAQNMHYAEGGPWTGEISASMLIEAGAQLVEIGHSERREFFNETDETVNLKVKTALNKNIKPLICVGESLTAKNNGISKKIISKQIKSALRDITSTQIENVIIAYEPIWAIGENGKPATPEQAEEIHKHIRSILAEMYSIDIANNINLLYGGSVDIDNALSLIQMKNIDGLFIGRSAWSAKGYLEIFKAVSDFYS